MCPAPHQLEDSSPGEACFCEQPIDRLGDHVRGKERRVHLIARRGECLLSEQVVELVGDAQPSALRLGIKRTSQRAPSGERAQHVALLISGNVTCGEGEGQSDRV